MADPRAKTSVSNALLDDDEVLRFLAETETDPAVVLAEGYEPRRKRLWDWMRAHLRAVAARRSEYRGDFHEITPEFRELRATLHSAHRHHMRRCRALIRERELAEEAERLKTRRALRRAPRAAQ